VDGIFGLFRFFACRVCNSSTAEGFLRTKKGADKVTNGREEYQHACHER